MQTKLGQFIAPEARKNTARCTYTYVVRPRSQLSVPCECADAQTRTQARNLVAHRRTSIAARDRRARPRRWTFRTGSGFPDSRVHKGSRYSLVRTHAWPGLPYFRLSLSLRSSCGGSKVPGCRRWLAVVPLSLSRSEIRGHVGCSGSRFSSLSLSLLFPSADDAERVDEGSLTQLVGCRCSHSHTNDAHASHSLQRKISTLLFLRRGFLLFE